jgi:hypothetical protein
MASGVSNLASAGAQTERRPASNRHPKSGKRPKGRPHPNRHQRSVAAPPRQAARRGPEVAPRRGPKVAARRGPEVAVPRLVGVAGIQGWVGHPVVRRQLPPRSETPAGRFARRRGRRLDPTCHLVSGRRRWLRPEHCRGRRTCGCGISTCGPRNATGLPGRRAPLGPVGPPLWPEAGLAAGVAAGVAICEKECRWPECSGRKVQRRERARRSLDRVRRRRHRERHWSRARRRRSRAESPLLGRSADRATSTSRRRCPAVEPRRRSRAPGDRRPRRPAGADPTPAKRTPSQGRQPGPQGRQDGRHDHDEVVRVHAPVAARPQRQAAARPRSRAAARPQQQAAGPGYGSAPRLRPAHLEGQALVTPEQRNPDPPERQEPGPPHQGLAPLRQTDPPRLRLQDPPQGRRGSAPAQQPDPPAPRGREPVPRAGGRW